MHIDSPLYDLVISILNSRGDVSIPGIGTFFKEEIEASLDEVTMAITPPHSIIRHEDRYIPERDIWKYIAGKDVDRKGLESSLQDVVFALDANETIDLGFGHFNLSKEGEKWTPKNIHLKGFLPPVQVHIKEVGTINSETLDIKGEQASNNESSNIKVTKSDSEVPPERLIDSAGPILMEEDKGAWSYIAPFLIFTLGLIVLSVFFKYCNDHVSGSEGNKERISEIPTPIQGEKVAKIEEEIPAEIFDNPNIQRYKEHLTQDILNNGCEIVVGNFEATANAQKMIDRAIKLNYNASLRESENAGKRVVITFDCASRDIADFLDLTRQELSKDAWMLRPLIDL